MVLAAFIYLIVIYAIGTPVTLYKTVCGSTQKVRTASFIATVLNVISIFAFVTLWLN